MGLLRLFRIAGNTPPPLDAFGEDIARGMVASRVTPPEIPAPVWPAKVAMRAISPRIPSGLVVLIHRPADETGMGLRAGAEIGVGQAQVFAVDLAHGRSR